MSSPITTDPAGAPTTTRLTIMRAGETGTQVPETFDVPFSQGMSVLDALMWLRANTDPTLAIRYSCITANACKECSVMVDGEVVYACAARLSQDGATVAPLENKAVIRDLVTELAPSRERLDALVKRTSS